MSVEEMISSFNRCSSYLELMRYYSKNSSMEIYGISRRENSHSAFLAWLLDPKTNGDLGNTPVSLLLSSIPIVKSYSEQVVCLENKYPDVWRKLISSNFEINVHEVRTEKIIDNQRRIDIFISGEIVINDQRRKINIIIENKVLSKEGKDQTTDYCDWLYSTHKDDINICFFLNPMTEVLFSSLKVPNCKSDNFISISYQFLVDTVLDPLLKISNSEHIKNFLCDYLRSLTINTLEIAMENKEERLMALSENERELLKDFWNKNEKIIMAAIYVQSQYGEIDLDEKEKLSGLYENLTDSEKHTNKYQLFVNDQLVYDNVKKTDWALMITKAAIENNLFNDESFNLWRSSTISHFGMLKEDKDILGLERKYRRYRKDPITYNGIQYFVTGNWGVGLYPKLEAMINKLFPEMRLSEIK